MYHHIYILYLYIYIYSILSHIPIGQSQQSPQKSESLTHPSIAPDPQGAAASDWQDLLASDDAMLWPGESMQKCL